MISVLPLYWSHFISRSSLSILCYVRKYQILFNKDAYHLMRRVKRALQKLSINTAILINIRVIHRLCVLPCNPLLWNLSFYLCYCLSTIVYIQKWDLVINVSINIKKKKSKIINWMVYILTKWLLYNIVYAIDWLHSNRQSSSMITQWFYIMIGFYMIGLLLDPAKNQLY